VCRRWEGAQTDCQSSWSVEIFPTIDITLDLSLEIGQGVGIHFLNHFFFTVLSFESSLVQKFKLFPEFELFQEFGLFQEFNEIFKTQRDLCWGTGCESVIRW